jgi:tetratricopeptide (TPR) repeat protein
MGLFGFGKSKEKKEEDQKLKREQRRIKKNITKKEEISLKVLEGYKTDFGRGVARIDYDSMAELDVDNHYVVEIKGKRRTVAVCLPLYPSDEGKGIVRIDEVIINNSETSIGDTISIKEIKAIPAEKIVAAPLTAIPPIDVRYFSDALEKIPLIKGDNFMLPYFDGQLKFEVIGVEPTADAVLITQKTVFHIGEKEVPKLVSQPDQEYWNKIKVCASLNESKRYEECLECYHKITQSYPQHHPAWNNKGRVLMVLGRYEEALECLNFALTIDPDDEVSIKNKIDIFEKINRYDDVINCYDQLIEKKPDDKSKILVSKAVAYCNHENMGQEKYEKAIKILEEAIKIDSDAAAHYHLGKIIAILGNKEKALECCNKSIAINDTIKESWELKRWLLIELKREDEAKKLDEEWNIVQNRIQKIISRDVMESDR